MCRRSTSGCWCFKREAGAGIPPASVFAIHICHAVFSGKYSLSSPKDTMVTPDGEEE